jgi:hypothetical protein
VVGVEAMAAGVGILEVNVAADSNDTTNTSDKRERSKRSLPFFIPNPPVEKVNAKSELINPYGIVNLSEIAQKGGNTRIHNSLIVQHSGSWPEGENQPNVT